MKRLSFQKLVAATTLIGAVLATASVAQASPDVRISIGHSGPVFVHPRPIYHATPPVVVQERDGRWSHRDFRQARYGHDLDRDGIPNRYDRDRDGDGVPNRFDRRPDNPYRR
jgi:hypothetical protein